MIHCLHGAVGSHRSWDQFQSSFPEPLNQIDLWRLFDHASPSLSEAGEMITREAAANDILLGYSMGGRLALHALLAEPTKWRAAIIISAHPGLTEGHDERRQRDEEWSILSLQKWQPFLRQWNKQGILSGSPQGFTAAPFEDRRAISKSFEHWSLGKQKDLRPFFPNISCPVLWLTGEKDPKFTTLAQQAVQLIPQGEHHLIPNCGHRLPWEASEPFIQAVRQFRLSL